MEAKPLFPAAQYVRMSTEDQQYPIATQEAAIQTYAKNHGYVVVPSTSSICTHLRRKNSEEGHRSSSTSGLRRQLPRHLCFLAHGAKDIWRHCRSKAQPLGVLFQG